MYHYLAAISNIIDCRGGRRKNLKMKGMQKLHKDLQCDFAVLGPAECGNIFPGKYNDNKGCFADLSVMDSIIPSMYIDIVLA